MRSIARGAGLSLLLAACALPRGAAPSEGLSLPVTAWFDDYDEVMTGHIATDPRLHVGFVDLQSEVSGIRCVGPARLVLLPPGRGPGTGSCEGMKGAITLGCSDGRQMAASWGSEGRCSEGFGVGKDEGGARFKLVYGGSDDTARAIVEDARANLASRPPLPPPPPPGGAPVAPPPKPPSTGSGFFVSRRGHLVTADHVVANATQVQVLLGDEMLDARIVAEDPEHDLALLEVRALTRPLPIRARSALEKGEDVVTLGFPVPALQGKELKANFGRVNALSGPQGDPRLAQIDVPIQPGNSGGPLLDLDGEVVGVVMGTLDPKVLGMTTGFLPQNVNYALKSEHVAPFVRASLPASAGEPAPPAGKPLSREQVVAKAEPSVVLVVAR